MDFISFQKKNSPLLIFRKPARIYKKNLEIMDIKQAVLKTTELSRLIGYGYVCRINDGHLKTVLIDWELTGKHTRIRSRIEN